MTVRTTTESISNFYGLTTPDSSVDDTPKLDSELESKRLQVMENMEIPVVNLFRDPEKFQAYLEFVDRFTGDVNHGLGLPPIQREVGGRTISYDYDLLSVMTKTASHMIHVRVSNESPIQTKQELRYFVVMYDFGEMKESIRSIDRAVDSNDAYGKTLTLFLSTPGIPKYPKIADPNPTDTVMQRAKVNRINEQRIRYNDANKEHLIFRNGPAEYYRGNYRLPEEFMSMSEVGYALDATAKALKEGLLDGEPGSRIFRDRYGLSVPADF